jgi:4-hydroxy-tetrahydrodipicolinate synthase
MDRAELKGRIRGTPVTLPTPFDKDLKVDFGRLTDMTHWWVEQGLGTDDAALKTSAAMGEGPDLNDDEWPHILRTVVNAAGPGKTVICGLKPKNTLHTIEDAKKAQDLGAIGLQVDLPFFHHSQQDDNVRHFAAISDAIDIGIMIYNTHWFCQNPVKEYMKAESMLRLKDSEHVVTIKWSVPDGEDYDQMTQFSDIFNVIDNSGRTSTVRCFKNGGVGYISALIATYPQHDQKVFALLQKGQYKEAQSEINMVDAALAPWMTKTGNVSGGYRQGKAMQAALGRPIGDPRPPTLPCTAEEINEVRGIMEHLGWTQPVGVAAD